MHLFNLEPTKRHKKIITIIKKIFGFKNKNNICTFLALNNYFGVRKSNI